MFGMGWQEILLILVIAVLVIGPDQLPQVARTVGKLIAQFRRLTNDLRDSLNKEFGDSEDFKDFKEFHQSIDAEFRSVSSVAQNYVEKEVAKEEQELRKLEQEVKDATSDTAPGEEPAEGGADAFPAEGGADAFPAEGGADAFPAEGGAEEPATGTNGSHEPTAASGSNGSSQDGGSDSPGGTPRKETA